MENDLSAIKIGFSKAQIQDFNFFGEAVLCADIKVLN